MQPDGIYFAGFFVLLAFMLAETLRHRDRFNLKDTLTNLVMYAGYLLVGTFWLLALYHIYAFVHQYRFFDLGPWWLDPYSPWFWVSWGSLLLLEDFCFYWFHRGSHRWGIFWASHVTHHSSTWFNLSTALRQSWFPFHTFVFWLPLPLLGFDPMMVIIMQLINLAWQALLHSQTDPWPRWFGAVFNTPTHHRVHHASNTEIIDRNFGGILIIWDRWFGTFARPIPEIRYGITRQPANSHPLWLQVHGWVEFLASLQQRYRKQDL